MTDAEKIEKLAKEVAALSYKLDALIKDLGKSYVKKTELSRHVMDTVREIKKAGL